MHQTEQEVDRVPDPGGVGDGSRGDGVSLVPETVGLESHAAVLQVLATVQTSAQLFIGEREVELVNPQQHVHSE